MTSRKPRPERLLIALRVSSVLARQTSYLLIPAVALLVLNASAMQLAVIGALESLPSLLFAIHGGLLVDRTDRKLVMVGSESVKAAVVLICAILFSMHAFTLWTAYALAFVIATASVIGDTALRAYIASGYAPDESGRLYAHLAAVDSGSQIAGNAAGGTLVGVLGGLLGFLALTAAHGCSVLISLTLPPFAASNAPVRRDRFVIRDGFKTLLGDRVLALSVVCNAFVICGMSLAATAFFVFLYRDLHFGPAQLGLILALSNAGFVGALVARRVTSATPRREMIAALFILGGGFAVLATTRAPHNLAFITLIAGELMISFAMSAYDVLQVSYRFRIVPADAMGSVTGISRAVSWSLWPLGTLLGGLLTSAIGARLCLLCAGATIAVGPVLLLLHGGVKARPLAAGCAPASSPVDGLDELESPALNGSRP